MRMVDTIEEAREMMQGDNILIYGRPKLGKSTLASKFPSPIFIATEPGLKYIDIEDKAKKYIFGWDKFKAIVNTLMQKEHSYKTVVIDTVDELVLMCQNFVGERDGFTHPADLGSKGWSAVTTELRTWINKICNSEEFTVIMIGHDKTSKLKKRNGEEWDFTTLNLGGKNREVVLAKVDHVFLLDVVEEDGVEKRIMRVQGSKYCDAGSRNPNIECKSTIDLSYEALLKCLIKEGG